MVSRNAKVLEIFPSFHIIASHNCIYISKKDKNIFHEFDVKGCTLQIVKCIFHNSRGNSFT